MTRHDAIVIRPAHLGDERALHHLAALDSARAPAGDVLVAEVAGRPLAALELGSGHAVADPFEPTASLVDLLRLHAGEGRRARGRRHALVPRLARAA